MSTLCLTTMGVDVHRLEKTRAPESMPESTPESEPASEPRGLVLGGVVLPVPYRLIGFSDADLVLHALTDALLAAAGQADIGTLFPTGSPRWQGASSTLFLAHALESLTEQKGRLCFADITLVAQVPRLEPFKKTIRERLAELLHLPEKRVSLKATTTDRLGFIGRELGMACFALTTVQLPQSPQSPGP